MANEANNFGPSQYILFALCKRLATYDLSSRDGVIVISNRNQLQSITFFQVIVIIINYN